MGLALVPLWLKIRMLGQSQRPGGTFVGKHGLETLSATGLGGRT